MANLIGNASVTMGPLHLLEEQILTKEAAIEDWFLKQWKKSTPPVYGSVDLRNAGFKLAPIDMNLFPAGFNNLNPNFFSLSVTAAKKSILSHLQHAKKILLIPESHTRNLYYWENVYTLVEILKQAQFEVRIGTLLADLQNPLQLPSGNVLQIEAMKRQDNVILVDGFTPDLILLNNDLSDGIPDILQNLAQPILPPAELGWSSRLKSEHFQFYSDVCAEFSNLIQIDPWFIAPLFRHCGEIDFMRREGEACLIANVEQLFAEITQKYKEYDIKSNPFIIIKADTGTYGMAVMTIRNIDEIRVLNRKQRSHMAKSKGGKPVHRVIIQEGVYTFETVGEANAIAEPVVYLWGDCVVGGFYRVHKERGVDENLNSPGMHFEPLPFVEPCKTNPNSKYQNRFYVYGVIARLSMLAAAREMQ